MRAAMIAAIARKDLREVIVSGKIWGPTLVMGLLQVIGLPLVMALYAREDDPQALADMGVSPALMHALLTQLPADLAGQVAHLPPTQALGIVVTGQLAAPLFLLGPLGLATVIAVSSFAGEKERGTLEALFYSPVADGELLLGKLLAAMLPAIALAWLTFGLYAIAENWASWSFLGRIWFPTAIWWPLVFWLTPALVVVETLLALVVSSRVRTQIEATQLSGFLLLPVTALAVSPTVWGRVVGPPTFGLAGAVLWLLNAGLVWLAVRTFSRQAMITRL